MVDDAYLIAELKQRHQDDLTFEAFPKIPRFREMIVTEKIDGTNAAVVVAEYEFGSHVEGEPAGTTLVMGKEGEDGFPDKEYLVFAQSRKRLITKFADNYGFAQWTSDNADDLAAVLGPGRHYGEWWGQGIQRNYGMDHKVFSLFNAKRWTWLNNGAARAQWEEDVRTICGVDASIPDIRCVPTLLEADFDTTIARGVLLTLEMQGSVAAPGFMDPEGIVIYQPNANRLSKLTRNGDGGKFSQ